MEYLDSAVIVVSSNLCAGPSPKTKVSFFLLSICTDELMSIPKIIAFLPNIWKGNQNLEVKKVSENRIYNPI